MTSWGERSFTRLLTAFVQLSDVQKSVTRKCTSCCCLRCFGVDYVSDPFKFVLLPGKAFSLSPLAGASFVPSPSFPGESPNVRTLMLHYFAFLTSGVPTSRTMNSRACTLVASLVSLCLPVDRATLSPSNGLKSTSPSRAHRGRIRIFCTWPLAGRAETNAVYDYSCW